MNSEVCAAWIEEHLKERKLFLSALQPELVQAAAARVWRQKRDAEHINSRTLPLNSGASQNRVCELRMAIHTAHTMLMKGIRDDMR